MLSELEMVKQIMRVKITRVKGQWVMSAAAILANQYSVSTCLALALYHPA